MNCRECGALVPTKSIVCPRCGFVPGGSTRRAGALALACVLAAVASWVVAVISPPKAAYIAPNAEARHLALVALTWGLGLGALVHALVSGRGSARGCLLVFLGCTCVFPVAWFYLLLVMLVLGGVASLFRA